MSLVKQLVLAMGLLLAAAFAGSYWISMDSSRGQMQAQLAAHAQDAATALGLSLAPHVADPAMTELLVNAIFDSGYFSRIEVALIEDGGLILQRERTLTGLRAPPWFIRLVDLRAQTGRAVVMRGWQQHAEVHVTSHPGFALDRLWQSALGMAGWLVLCGVIGILLATWLLRRQLRPLRSLAAQASAVGRREYRIQSNLPSTAELRPLVLAMNQMVTRVKRLMEAEAKRTESYRREAYEDPLTGLPNRLAFEYAMSAALTSEQEERGFVLAARLPDLAALNQTQSAERVNSWLRKLGENLQEMQRRQPRWLAARVRGGEFMLLAPSASLDEMRECAENLAHALNETPLQLGIAAYREGEASNQAMRRIDQAIGQSRRELNVITPGIELTYSTAPERSAEQWQEDLSRALNENRLLAHFQPAIAQDHPTPLHHKLLARLATDQGELITAGSLLPWITRFGLGTQFDLCVLDMALAHLGRQPGHIAMSITAETLFSDAALDALARKLDAHREAAARLIIEVDARQLLGHEALDDLIWLVRPYETEVALQHFGHSLTLIGDIALLGLAYLKVDSAFLRDLDTLPGKQTYLRVLVDAANTAELQLIAEQVQTEAERQALQALGITAWQGYAVSEPGVWSG
ncbi:EAL domain-containing protein [Pseudomonas sp.]|uniref:EAL domain-containing protein n=1 Tax=Pseudomonas sp. TaxID=306 RepID=UPI00272D6943|nr:LapD/MoxY N-terminal periplasmic domain-containing protein [Pseudomonas sp.]